MAGDDNQKGRVPTGIDEYDKMLGGGFLDNTLNLITGCSGAGKTLFSLTFLYRGAMRYGDKGIYITLEESADQVVRDARSIGVDLASQQDAITILDIAKLRRLYTNKEELSQSDSLLDIDVLLDIISRNAEGAKRIVIDSIVPLSMRYPNANEFRASLFRLMTTLKETKATIIFTTEVDSSEQRISRFGIEDFLADSVTILRQGAGESFRERYIRVHKIRGSNHRKSFVEYSIQHDGIHIMLSDI